MRTYLVTGLLAGVAAVLMISRVDSVKVGYGNSYLLQAVLVVILGGVSDVGGSGTVLDVVFSILMLRVISSGFNIAGFTEYFRNVIWGSLLVVVTAANNLVPLAAARLRNAARRSRARIRTRVQPAGVRRPRKTCRSRRSAMEKVFNGKRALVTGGGRASAARS